MRRRNEADSTEFQDGRDVAGGGAGIAVSGEGRRGENVRAVRERGDGAYACRVREEKGLVGKMIYGGRLLISLLFEINVKLRI